MSVYVFMFVIIAAELGYSVPKLSDVCCPHSHVALAVTKLCEFLTV